jgi:hypothetical protein
VVKATNVIVSSAVTASATGPSRRAEPASAAHPRPRDDHRDCWLLAACGGTAPPGDHGRRRGLAMTPDAAATSYEHATAITIESRPIRRRRCDPRSSRSPDRRVFAADTGTCPLVAAELTGGEVVPFAGNTLAIVAPAGNPGGLVSPFDLGRPGLAIVAAGASVPISGYVATLLENLARLPGAPVDLVARYDANVVTREDNVAAVLSKIGWARRRSDRRDGRRSPAVEIVELRWRPTSPRPMPASSRRPRTRGGRLPRWIAGPAGQAIWRFASSRPLTRRLVVGAAAVLRRPSPCGRDPRRSGHRERPHRRGRLTDRPPSRSASPRRRASA